MHKYLNLFNKAYLSLFIDEIVETDSYSMFFSDNSRKWYWNAVNMFNARDVDLYESIIDFELIFSSRNLIPTAWVCADDRPKFIEQALKDKGYVLMGIEEWLKLDNYSKVPVLMKGIDIREVKTTEELETFIRIFDSVWGEKNPGYSDTFRKKILDPRFKRWSKVYIGYVKGVPVCVGGFVKHNNVAFIHSIATVEHMRKNGYATAMINYIVNFAEAKEFIVQADQSSFVPEVYKKLGFKPLMPVKYYFKKF